MKFNLGIFNVRGLKSEIKKEKLCGDIYLVCLQETKIANGADADRTIKQYRLLCFKSNLKDLDVAFL